MSDLKQGRSGWLVDEPSYMEKVPTTRNDLFREVHDVQCDFDATSEQEAKKESVKLLIGLKKDAEWKLEYFSKPSEVVKESNRVFMLQKAKEHLKIANAGLTVLGLTKQEIEERCNRLWKLQPVER